MAVNTSIWNADSDYGSSLDRALGHGPAWEETLLWAWGQSGLWPLEFLFPLSIRAPGPWPSSKIQNLYSRDLWGSAFLDCFVCWNAFLRHRLKSIGGGFSLETRMPKQSVCVNVLNKYAKSMGGETMTCKHRKELGLVFDKYHTQMSWPNYLTSKQSTNPESQQAKHPKLQTQSSIITSTIQSPNNPTHQQTQSS